MKTEKISIDDVFVSPKNVRRHPQKQIQELVKSFNMFGQYRPLIIGSDGEILIGNGMYEALKAAGAKEIEVKRLPDNTSREYKNKLMLADNKTYMLGVDDVINIDEIMKSLDDFEIPGFDESILADLYADMANIDVSTVGSMGVPADDRIQTIKRTEEIRKDEDKEVVNVSRQDTVQPEKYNNTEYGKSYITCPHCGGKIWQ